MRIWILAAIAVFVSSSAFAACPCDHKIDGLPGITSASPIPAAHAACLRPVYRATQEFKRYIAKANHDKARNAHQSNYDRQLTIDWGVPPKAVAEKMISDSKDGIAKFTERLRNEKLKVGDPDHTQTIVRDNMSLWESVVMYDTALISYANCVLKNDLPPTSR